MKLNQSESESIPSAEPSAAEYICRSDTRALKPPQNTTELPELRTQERVFQKVSGSLPPEPAACCSEVPG